MKTLADHGKKIRVYKETHGDFTRRNCPCGIAHFIMKKPKNRYIQCDCGRLIEL